MLDRFACLAMALGLASSMDDARASAEAAGEAVTDRTATRDALAEFEYQRMVRVQTLRAVHAIAAAQPVLIGAIASAQAMPQADRARVNEKVALLQMRLDESANLIQSLDGVGPERWVDREREVSDAMNRLEDARADAWEALDEANQLDQTSMR